MIKSTKTTLKFTNVEKLNKLHQFIEEYRDVVSQFINLLWSQENLPTLVPKALTSQINTWLSKRAVQAAAKQASGVIRGTKKKQKQRLYVYNKLVEEGKYKQARKLKRIIDSTTTTKPNISDIQPELDQRFIKQDWENTTIFDGIVTLSSLGRKYKIPVPIKKTKHFNKLLAKGNLKLGIRLSKQNITFMFTLPEVPKKTVGAILGLDIGVKNVFTLSNGISSQPDIHGHTLDSINKKLSRKKKGSKAFLRAQQHRTNYINWSLNQLNLENVKTIRAENIKHLRKGSKTSRYLSHFTYTEIYSKLENLSETNGVHIERLSPTYTSQRCSKCGWVCSRNRKGKQFKCVVCKFSEDADLNAAKNISTPLKAISKEQRLLHKNRKGFYWNEIGKEFIVSSTPET